REGVVGLVGPDVEGVTPDRQTGVGDDVGEGDRRFAAVEPVPQAFADPAFQELGILLDRLYGR
ncbi:MAG: hypothetical protein AAF211_21395, partial [Myxococcota bacterium]